MAWQAQIILLCAYLVARCDCGLLCYLQRAALSVPGIWPLRWPTAVGSGCGCLCRSARRSLAAFPVVHAARKIVTAASAANVLALPDTVARLPASCGVAKPGWPARSGRRPRHHAGPAG